MSIATENRLRELQQHVLELMRRVAELEKQLAQRTTLRVPKNDRF